ncbi:DinB family protein [Cytobacillus sp. Sa5YUA1]|uniref:DinB family protein n=1 Tax=Cytobacillus stercorigallinarum TaxID=2762240 RepID=A0ABR8QPH1_9BACI|nr:DinB family protein [Cytobacillus stercorigallinarum]MBD7937444.1 DinB family protein [Cytobacillus stercorigallinarum]
MSETKTIEQSIESIQTSLDQIIETVSGLSEESIRWNPTEDEWSIMQIITHLNEALPYWLGEIDTVVKAPGSQWGRGLQDPARLAAVENTEQQIVEDELKKLALIKQDVQTKLSVLSADTLAQESPHRNFAKFGNKPVFFIVDHFIDEHAAGHYNQIQRNLSKLAK